MEKVKYTAEEIMGEELIQLPEPDWTGTLKEGKSKSIKNPLYGKGGLYIISLGEDVVYVGVSKTLQVRLYNHYNRKSDRATLISHLSGDYGEEKAREIRDEVKVTVYLIKDTLEADFLEAYLINKYKPKYNLNSEGKSRAGGYNNKRKDPLEKYKEDIITKYSKKGLSMSAIGREYKCTHKTISNRLSSWGVPLREDKYHKNISIEDKKRAVYEHRYEGKTQTKIAGKYGLSVSAISKWNKQFSDAEINELEDATAH